MSTQTDDPLSLDDLLDLIRDTLIAGDLSGLTDMARKVETATAALPRLDLSSADRLRGKADRNARLLQAAARGVRAAQARLTQIAAGPTLSIYDARGQRKILGAAPLASPKRF